MQALSAQFQLLSNLVERNGTALNRGGERPPPEESMQLPFVLMHAAAKAQIDIKLSRDTRDAVLDFGKCAPTPPPFLPADAGTA